MNFKRDPVSAIAKAISDFMLLITKAIPSDEERMKRFELKQPRLYSRMMKRLYRTNKVFLIKNKEVDIDTHVDLVNGDLPASVRTLLKKNLHLDLKR